MQPTQTVRRRVMQAGGPVKTQVRAGGVKVNHNQRAAKAGMPVQPQDV